MTKLRGYQFYEQVLKRPKYMVAPMVDGKTHQQVKAWRILSRRYGADLVYTPMLHSRLFVENPEYRSEYFTTCPGDRPLIVQFCANDPELLLNAARYVEDQCDAVDINLGCPQNIARRGHYGSYLQDEWELIEKMVKKLDQELKVPVTCKIRVFDDVDKTIRYAKMLEAAGCQLLTVHGRTREMKGHNSGLADWEQIRRIKEAVSIPVFANGNILYFEDIEKCLEATKADGVMSAEANLYNPGLFANVYKPVWAMAQEYLDICEAQEGGSTVSMIRGHLFKLFQHILPLNTDIRSQLARSFTMDRLRQAVNAIQERYADKTEEDPSTFKTDDNGYKVIPPWICQPYIRPPPLAKKGQENQGEETEEGAEPKRKKVKVSSKPLCMTKHRARACGNLRSAACPWSLCKSCCQLQATRLPADWMPGHAVPEEAEKGTVCPSHKVYRLEPSVVN